jgi:signal transduction histidine kinase
MIEKSALRKNIAMDLIKSSERQVDALLPIFLLPEFRGGEELLLESILKEESLEEIKLIQNLKNIQSIKEGKCLVDNNIYFCGHLLDENIVSIIPISDGENVYGYIYKKKSIINRIGQESYQSVFTFATIFFTLLVLVMILYSIRVTMKDIPKEAKLLLNEVQNSFIQNKKESDLELVQFKFDEFEILSVTLIELLKKNKRMNEKVYISEVAKQVAHDIQSPLAALEIVMDDIKNLPEDSRELTLHAIHRIQEIANNLSRAGEEKNESELILPKILIRNLINEKKIEFQNLTNLEIEYTDNSELVYFIKSNDTELSRIFSNMINNACEAIKSNGKICINMEITSNQVVVTINDTGSGFPVQILEDGISQGKSIGKDNGQGLGLHHAVSTIKKFGGELVLSNPIYGGAQVEVTLPCVQYPIWFKENLNLSSFSKLIVIDDDQSIHDVWNLLLKGTDFEIIIEHVYTPQEVESSLKGVSEDTLVLIDYDLRQNMTGINYINKFNLKNVVLVTSNYDTKEVVEYCEENSIQLLPKQLVSSIKLI